MPFGGAYGRLAASYDREVARAKERQEARVAQHDRVTYSAQDRAITYWRGGQPLWTARATLMARLVEDLGILRWWWYGAMGAVPRSELDVIVATGQQQQVEELAEESVNVETLAAADGLCSLAGYLAHAEGVTRLPEGEGWAYYALYETLAAHLTVPVPARGPSVPPAPAPRAMQSVLPVAEAAPTEGPPSREPPRELLEPAIDEAVAVVRGSLANSFRQALLTIALDVQGAKARFFVHVVASNADGELVEMEPSQRLFDAVGALIAEHRRRGGALWRKLLVRMRLTERGASTDVRVV